MTIELQRHNDSGALLNELAMRHQSGDIEAFSELYELLNEKVYWQLTRLGLSAEDAQDGMQQVFEKAFKAIDQFQAGNVGAWVSAIAHNYAMDYHRKATLRRRHFADTPIDEGNEPIDEDSGFVELDTKWLVEDIIEQVKRHDKKAFESLGLEAILYAEAAGRTREEMSESLGINAVTLGTRLTRLRNRLADSAFTRDSLQ